ncbi:DUF1624 domain-containing protein [Solitalea koreensis]|uniref:Uncharacterized membrane protein n=1 Tax=Solitalea koreensis TaxID=543615 RepID=A0A521BR43_9SPHI|nr:heparan-alpha-glucosaminide N-acetyltransferase domain-containing protein [Solitalea koreensis]SMO49579.1 Uncharacterized membrane protein [Solitalea koreensis]
MKSFSTASSIASSTTRIISIDLLRGIIMVIMALDHVRDYFSIARFNPLDLTQTTPDYYFTRWITHLCAPNFVFLAGVGAFLMQYRGKPPKEMSMFLFTRGLWMIILEFTIVRFGWSFSLADGFSVAQVIWVIGWAMILLSALVRLPLKAIAVIGLSIILFHNALDGIKAEQFGNESWIWNFVHQPNIIKVSSNYSLFALYSLIPWVAVMACGYCFGYFFTLPSHERLTSFLWIGSGMILTFLILRFANVYGDPHPWTVQKNGLYSFLSFMNVEKYPPSLLYLDVTIGIGILLLALFEKANGPLVDFFTIYGRVPLFYYVSHIYLVHFLALIAAQLTLGRFDFMIGTPFNGFGKIPYGFELPMVYLMWILAILILYYPCRWFAGVKKRNKAVWLSYL